MHIPFLIWTLYKRCSHPLQEDTSKSLKRQQILLRIFICASTEQSVFKILEGFVSTSRSKRFSGFRSRDAAGKIQRSDDRLLQDKMESFKKCTNLNCYSY
jgi:hypothetical protein